MLQITSCHLLKAPSGRWTFVGRVPESLCFDRDATREDIMGGRSHRRGDGSVGCLRPRSFDSEGEARGFARSHGVELAN